MKVFVIQALKSMQLSREQQMVMYQLLMGLFNTCLTQILLEKMKLNTKYATTVAIVQQVLLTLKQM